MHNELRSVRHSWNFFHCIFALAEMEVPKVIKVSILIKGKYLDDMRQSVTEKGGSVESGK